MMNKGKVDSGSAIDGNATQSNKVLNSIKTGTAPADGIDYDLLRRGKSFSVLNPNSPLIGRTEMAKAAAASTLTAFNNPELY